MLRGCRLVASAGTSYPDRMNRAASIFVLGATIAGAACGAPQGRLTDDPATAGARLDSTQNGGPIALGRPNVERAVRDERIKVQSARLELDRAIDEGDGHDDLLPVKLAVLRADITARASFVAQLELCLVDSTECPPTLDEPTVPHDYDPDSGDFATAIHPTATEWPATAAQIEKSACGCRTGACVNWVTADLDRWEAAVPADAPSDDAAVEHVTGARACLWSRLGKRAHRVNPDDSTATAE
jgi:hypothetical protein